MTGTPPAVTAALLARFEGAWRDDTPIFGCCRKSVATAVEGADIPAIATLDPAARVRALRAAVEEHTPGYFGTHRCCAGHVTDLAFDLPDLLGSVAHA
ncbi:MAG: hypothetical protein M3O86_00760 [Actinomycetota bacterium]|nr:hypothetical protein [Actinomycetota bacterium]